MQKDIHRTPVGGKRLVPAHLSRVLGQSVQQGIQNGRGLSDILDFEFTAFHPSLQELPIKANIFGNHPIHALLNIRGLLRIVIEFV
ncbi:hypothetical protein D3C75_1306310 [compost metagenome]